MGAMPCCSLAGRVYDYDTPEGEIYSWQIPYPGSALSWFGYRCCPCMGPMSGDEECVAYEVLESSPAWRLYAMIASFVFIVVAIAGVVIIEEVGEIPLAIGLLGFLVCMIGGHSSYYELSLAVSYNKEKKEGRIYVITQEPNKARDDDPTAQLKALILGEKHFSAFALPDSVDHMWLQQIKVMEREPVTTGMCCWAETVDRVEAVYHQAIFASGKEEDGTVHSRNLGLMPKVMEQEEAVEIVKKFAAGLTEAIGHPVEPTVGCEALGSQCFTLLEDESTDNVRAVQMEDDDWHFYKNNGIALPPTPQTAPGGVRFGADPIIEGATIDGDTKKAGKAKVTVSGAKQLDTEDDVKRVELKDGTVLENYRLKHKLGFGKYIIPIVTYAPRFKITMTERLLMGGDEDGPDPDDFKVANPSFV